MRFVIALTCTLGLLFAIVHSGGATLSIKDLVHQECHGTQAEIVFLTNIRVEHPLGENTCGEGKMTSIPAIGVE